MSVDLLHNPFSETSGILLQAADSALREFFGVRFALFGADDEGRLHVVAAASLSGDACENTDVDGWPIEEFLSTGDPQLQEPRVLDLSDGRPLLLLPIRQHGQTVFVAAAAYDSELPDLLLRLARAFLREWNRRDELDQLHEENNQFVQQVSDDFEELSFLRSTAGALNVSDPSYDLVEMAKGVLPLLNQSVKAKGLFLVAAGKKTDGTPEVGSVLVRTGPEPIADDLCIRLVKQYAAEAVDEPVVRNSFHEPPEGQPYKDVRRIVLVPLNNAEQCLGWLVGVNLSFLSTTADVRWALSEHEFGTHEASLMVAAASILTTHATNVELFREKQRLLISVVRSLVSAVEAKDAYTHGHSERVALFGKRLAEQLGYSQDVCDRLYLTGLLHDVGKIGVSDATLSNPGRLSDEQFDEIKRHPDEGWAILHDLEQLKYVLPGVLYHHERYDGKGYPDGLAGRNIPIDGRILAVADAYDAMTSDRPYRQGMSQEKATAILREGAGTQWDLEMVDAFFTIMSDIIAIRNDYQPKAKVERNDQPSESSGVCGSAEVLT